MRGVCIIPARGGSKRLPRKNIAEFLGRPILAHTVDAARASGVFERVVVSTEDAEIEAVARSAQCNLHLRLIEGHNLHHIVEISFKAFARALREAVEFDPRAPGVPSTKGTLT